MLNKIITASIHDVIENVVICPRCKTQVALTAEDYDKEYINCTKCLEKIKVEE